MKEATVTALGVAAFVGLWILVFMEAYDTAKEEAERESAVCHETGAVTGRDVQWHDLSGCYVRVDGRWIPLRAWQGEFAVGEP